MNQRYAGKPLLRLLELYILRFIGEIKEHDEELMRKMAPKLKGTFGVDGQWYEMIRKGMELPDTFEAAVVESWKKNRQIAFENGLSLVSEEYVQWFVDENLV